MHYILTHNSLPPSVPPNPPEIGFVPQNSFPLPPSRDSTHTSPKNPVENIRRCTDSPRTYPLAGRLLSMPFLTSYLRAFAQRAEERTAVHVASRY
jgi:hypothetical protein